MDTVEERDFIAVITLARETAMVEKTKFYRVEEVAEILGLDEQLVRHFLRDGYMKGRKIGKRYYVTEPDLQAFIDGTHAAQAHADSAQRLLQALVEMAEAGDLTDKEPAEVIRLAEEAYKRIEAEIEDAS
jgi:excisionase family DNA binding protein